MTPSYWANARCPICDGPVVTAPTIGGVSGMASPRNREELIVSCAEHGRTPYNDATLKYLEQERRR